MKVELPEFKKCCYCIPLRYGLLVWGYIKLVITCTMFIIGSLILQMYMQLVFFLGFSVLPLVFLGIFVLLLLMVDIAMTIVFIIGGHRKTLKLFKIFYIYSLVFLGVMAGLLLISTVFDLSTGVGDSAKYRNSHPHQHISYGAIVVTKVVTGVVLLVVQAYVVLLIRSEVNKLQNNRNFRFTNIATEAECAMENRNDPGPGTLVYTNGIEDHGIGLDDKLEGDLTKAKERVSNEGTFNYDKF